jgi:hypothetical protein
MLREPHHMNFYRWELLLAAEENVSPGGGGGELNP